MTSTTTKLEASQPAIETSAALLDDWFDPIEAGPRERVRDFIEEMIREELDGAGALCSMISSSAACDVPSPDRQRRRWT
jgi:hypothetical protein